MWGCRGMWRKLGGKAQGPLRYGGVYGIALGPLRPCTFRNLIFAVCWRLLWKDKGFFYIFLADHYLKRFDINTPVTTIMMAAWTLTLDNLCSEPLDTGEGG